jgi:hypothetical protein
MLKRYDTLSPQDTILTTFTYICGNFYFYFILLFFFLEEKNLKASQRPSCHMNMNMQGGQELCFRGDKESYFRAKCV